MAVGEQDQIAEFDAEVSSFELAVARFDRKLQEFDRLIQAEREKSENMKQARLQDASVGLPTARMLLL